MRLSICLFINLLYLQLPAYSFQIESKVSISGTYTLQKIFQKIEQQTGKRIFYANSILNDQEKVNIKAVNNTITEVLSQVLSGKKLEWSIEPKFITIVEIRNQPTPKSTFTKADTTITVTGRVTNEEGEPIIGATVVMKGTKSGVTTTSDGNFEINHARPNTSLVISNIGYLSQEISYKRKGSLGNIQLKEYVGKLDETIIIAYGITTKRYNTGSISSLKSEDIRKQPVNNPLLALQGRVPGMSIIQENGIPGSGIRIQVRGQNSLNGSQPLYIIDGVPIEPNILGGPASLDYFNSTVNRSAQPSAFNFINPGDIESIEVLKDADATSIYGSRGANGVILITTKKGAIGDPKIDASLSQGIGKTASKLNLLNRRQYLDMRYEALKNDGKTIGSGIGGDVDLTQWDTTRYTDWQKELLGHNASFTNAQASISGGNTSVVYLVGGNFHKETTVFPGDFSDTKGGVHLSLSGSSKNQKLQVQLKANYMMDNNNLPISDFTSDAVKLSPVAPKLYNNDKTLNWQNSTWNNPLARIYQPYEFKNDNILSNIILSYKILSNLDVKINTGYNNTKGESYTATPFAALNPDSRQNSDRSADFINTNAKSWIIEPQLNYWNNIGLGKLNVLLGGSYQNSYQTYIITSGQNFDNDAVLRNLAAAQTYYSRTSNSDYKYNAIFGRISYNLKEKYLININARRDGSSRFGPGNQFGNFGSVGAAWIFSNERFIKNNLPVLSFGKLRASYGSSGNDQINDYAYLQQYQYTDATYVGAKGLNTLGLYDNYYHWEVTKKLEAGLETGLLSNKILLTFNYYRNRSGNQLLPAPLASYVGPGTVIINRNALVQNSGYEISLNSSNITSKKFTWNTSFNISTNKNKLLKYANLEGSTDDFLLDIGQPINRLRVFQLAGVDSETGKYQFYDKQGKLTFSPINSTDESSDKIKYIDLNPKFFGAIENNISYKGITLDFLFQFVKQTGKNYLYSPTTTPGGFYAGNQPTDVLNRWQKNGDISTIQRFNQNFQLNSAANNARNSDQSFSDASYIRLKNISLSYDFPLLLKEKLGVKNLRLFMQCQNLLTISRYKGLDPETQNINVLPPLRVIMAGINLNL